MRVVIGGALAQRPSRGGHAWVFLQYLLGFRELGYDVLFVDRLDPPVYEANDADTCPPDSSRNLDYLHRVMDSAGLADAFAVVVDGGHRSLGLERENLVSWVKSADLLVDVMGYLRTEELLDASPFSVFLDIDPGFTQMWCDLGLYDPRGSHDAYATFGVNIGREGCTIPTCGVDWIPTRPPVVLAEWPVQPIGERRLTSVCSWRGPYDAVEYRGATYGLRAHRMRAIADLPLHSDVPLELALDIDAFDEQDLRLLSAGGWRLSDPLVVADSPASYRHYIQASAGELSATKDMYVRSRSGWFSDRSVCYLASGRPVIAQDTAIRDIYPVGKGLLHFDDIDGAAEAIRAVFSDYATHAVAARELAEAEFASGVVLPRLLDDLAAA